MAESKDLQKNLESLGPMLMGEGMPAFDPRKVSPYAIQKKLEEGIAHHQAGRKEEAARERAEFLKLKKQTEAVAPQ